MAQHKNTQTNDSSAKPIIDAKNLCYTYQGAQQPALAKVSLEVTRGEFLAVLGHNGSGKSTLAKLFNALYIPTDGAVWVCGMDTRVDELTYDIRQNAGMVFQNPDNQLVATIVEEDVAFGLENIGVPPAAIRERVDDALRVVGMTDFRDAAPHMLSGGQKQRIAIAGVIAMRPQVIIFDESTAMLDPHGRKEVLATVSRLNKEEGITIVWITHFMQEAVKADRVLVINEGEVALEGTPREVFSHVDEMRSLRLDVPPMTQLAQSLIAKGIPLRYDILTVEEMVEEICRLSSIN